MGKSLEERIVRFTVEFVKAVAGINEDLICGNYTMRYGKKIIYFENITLDEITVEDFLKFTDEDQEDVQEFTENDDCVAYMVCEGELYEKMYGYDAYREDIFGDGDEAKNLYHALFDHADKYNLWFDWAGGGLMFYDKA